MNHRMPRRIFVRVLLATVCVASLQQAHADETSTKKKAEKPLAKLLIGSWKMKSIESRGAKKSSPFEMTFTFDGKQVKQKAVGRVINSDYKLDAKHKEHLNIVRKRGDQEMVFQMIYKIDGDKLMICSGRPGSERPSKFTSKDGYSIQVLERIKE